MPELQPVWRRRLADEAATAALARDAAQMIGAGSVLTLSGDLGAGKTTFARALIRHLTGDPALEVPSPTFTLMQAYDRGAYPIVHADFYRLRGAGELAELGFDEAADGALLVVEWAERAAEALPADRLDIAFRLAPDEGDEARVATLTGHGALGPIVDRARAIHALLEGAGWRDAARAFMLGDASTRAYERLTRASGETAILMISPARPDGPPVRYGKPYSAIARLAENIRPFIAVGEALARQGVSAPRILGYDLDAGLAILEDLGADPFVDDNGPMPARYAEATALLAHLHARDLPASLPLRGEADYRIPPYDIDAYLIEVELMLEWYAPHRRRVILSSGARAVFVNLWRQALADVIAARQTWTLRDFHSPNLIWLAGREGLKRVGVIDFQDCLIGHPAYDLASLLQDARVTVPDALELRLLGQYSRQRAGADPHFDPVAFVAAYAVLGAQRATKILGIFARLDKRDGKPQYLRHLPRIESYMRKSLAHPALEDLRQWFAEHMPYALAGDDAAGAA